MEAWNDSCGEDNRCRESSLMYYKKPIRRPIRLSQAQLFQLPSNRFKEGIKWALIHYYLLSHLQDYSIILLLLVLLENKPYHC